jgi:hypothetical protein
MEEIPVVTPPGIERTTRKARNRAYKAFPRPKYINDEDDDRKLGGSSEPSISITLANEKKGGSPVSTTASTGSEAEFGEDYYAPSFLRSDGNKDYTTMTTSINATRTASHTHLTNFRVSSPHALSDEDEERTADIDLPFDQAGGTIARDKAVTTSTMAMIGSARHSSKYNNLPTCPFRNPHVSDFDDSHLSSMSNRFESIWMSSPEASPDRAMSTRANNTQLHQERTTAFKPVVTRKHVAKIDELNERIGRFVIPPPRYSDPQPWSGPLSPPSHHRSSDVSSSTTRTIKDSATNAGEAAPSASTNPTTTTPSKPNLPVFRFEKDMSPSPPRSRHHEKQETTSFDHQLTVVGKQEEPQEDSTHDSLTVRSKDEDTLFDFDGNEEDDVVDLDDDVDRNLKVTRKMRRRARQRSENDSATDDDTSVENYGSTSFPSTSLQERTHQAWKSRQKKNSSLRSQKDPTQPKSSPRHSVSFGNSNMVHHFNLTAEEEYDKKQHYEDGASLDRSSDRSLNSEYTKTLESEVEDMIKDILFIGKSDKSKPGRRKFKDKPEIRRKLKQRLLAMAMAAASEHNKQKRGDVHESNKMEILEESLEENEIFSSADLDSEPVVDPTIKKAQQQKPKKVTLNESVQITENVVSSKAPSRSTCVSDDRSSVVSASSADSQTVVTLQTIESFHSDKNGSDDPFAAMVGFVEGGLSAMTSAVSYAFGESESPSSQQQTRGRTKTRDGEQPSKVAQCRDFNIFESCMGGGRLFEGTDGFATNNAISVAVVQKLAQDMWYNNTAIAKSASDTQSFHENSDKGGDVDEMERRLLQLANGSKVSLLALHAAHSVHKLQGVEYDESIPIDMSTELKVCPVTLKLPMGIIFLENNGLCQIPGYKIFLIWFVGLTIFSLVLVGGCFVTKVSPDGSAARSGGVEVGDQLACINGASSLYMKVDDICDVIANSLDPSMVELVFLRYIGPFRAAKKTLLETESNFRLQSNGSFDDSLAEAEGRNSKSSWRMNPSKSDKKEPGKKIVKEMSATKKKKKGFRLFGRGKKKTEG